MLFALSEEVPIKKFLICYRTI